MDNKKLIGQRINSALAKGNMLQKDLAKKLNVMDNMVSYYASGTRVPNVEQIIKISKILNVSTDYLLGLNDNPSTDPTQRAITEKYGLFNDVIKKLEEYQTNKGYEKVIDFLNMLIESEDFVPLANSCMDYLTAQTLWNRRKQDYKKETGTEMPESPNDGMVKSIDIKGYIKSKKFDVLIETLVNDDKFRNRILKIFNDGISERQHKVTYDKNSEREYIEAQENIAIGSYSGL